MNIPWIPLTNSHVKSIRRTSVGMAAGIATLAWSLNGSVADAQQRTLQHDGRSIEVVPADQMESVFQTSGNEIMVSEFDRNFPLVHGSQFAAGTRGNGQCGGQCGGNCGGATCGGGACGGGACGGGLLGGNRNGCNDGCATCNPFCYGRVEAVYMRRGDLDNFTRSRTPGLMLDEPDFEAAPRITIGTSPDCVTGYEASFVGPLNFDTSRSAIGASGRTLIRDTEQPDGIFRLYDDATVPVPTPDSVQFQRYQSDYWSVEASKTSMAWDIAKLLFGPRYIRFDEQYDYTGASNAATSLRSGSINTRARNNLIGLQVGADIFNPVCRSTSAYFRGRAGGFYNDAESTTYVNNSVYPLGGPAVNAARYGGRDSHGGFAAMFEIGGGLQYQISEMFSVQGGGELWYLTQVATAEDQIPTVVGVGAAYRGTKASDDVFFAGFNVGATMKY